MYCLYRQAYLSEAAAGGKRDDGLGKQYHTKIMYENAFMATSQFGNRRPSAFSASRTSRLLFDFLALRTICSTNNKKVSSRLVEHCILYYTYEKESCLFI